MILRLIRNALTTRGWLIPAGGLQAFTVNSMATAAQLDPSLSSDPITIPSDQESDYQYSEHPDASFLLDGFPRNAVQAAQLEEMVPVNLAIHVHTPFSIIESRMSNRWVHPASGRVYNATFNAPKLPGKDDITGEPLVQRDDDKPEVWRSRLKTFEDSSRDLLGFYQKKGVLWKVEGESSDEITPRIFKEFERRFGET
jgi:adenylate kinase